MDGGTKKTTVCCLPTIELVLIVYFREITYFLFFSSLPFLQICRRDLLSNMPKLNVGAHFNFLLG